jgi:hypothetical protein
MRQCSSGGRSIVSARGAKQVCLQRACGFGGRKHLHALNPDTRFSRVIRTTQVIPGGVNEPWQIKTRTPAQSTANKSGHEFSWGFSWFLKPSERALY